MDRHYEKRMKEHKQRVANVRRAQLERARHERVFEVEALLEDYEAAFKLANNRTCTLVYRHGWVFMAEVPTFRVRLKALGALAQELRDAADHGLDHTPAID